MDVRRYPTWLLDGKEHINNSTEWSKFVEELYDVIQQQLTESHVQSFLDLTDTERNLFVARATNALQGGDTYRALTDKVSVSLDQHLNNEVSRQLLEDFPIDTKTDLVLDCVQDGAIAILKKWPDMKSKLRICFNQPLPSGLRQLAWRLFLDNPSIRKRYLDQMSNNPKNAISKLDLEISQKCEHILESEPSFEPIKGSIGAFYGAKAVLSYHHTLTKSKDRLPDVDYFLVIPFVHVASRNYSRREPPPSAVVTLLVEEYLSFMKSRPLFMTDTEVSPPNNVFLITGVHLWQESDVEIREFANVVSKHLLNVCPDVADIITRVYAPSREAIVETDAGEQNVLIQGLVTFLRPLARVMLSGYLSLPTLLFVWDQYMLGVGIPGYSVDFLSIVMTIVLMLLKDRLLPCENAVVLEAVVRNEAPKLTVAQFQFELKANFYQQLFGKLNEDNSTAQPVLDPTQTRFAPWHHWFKDTVPQRTTTEDRRRAREERQEERERLLQKQHEEQEARRLEREREKRQNENQFAQQVAEDRRRMEDARMRVEDELEAERRRRLETEKAAQVEIDRMRKEIDLLRRKKQKSAAPSIQSLTSAVSNYLIPPPNTAQPYPVTPRLSPERLPTPVTVKQPRQAVEELLRRIYVAFNNVAHGQGEKRLTLDTFTKQCIVEHRQDVKEAELEIFGHPLKEGEFEQLPQEEKEEVSDRIMEIIKTKLQNKRQQELSQSQR